MQSDKLHLFVCRRFGWWVCLKQWWYIFFRFFRQFLGPTIPKFTARSEIDYPVTHRVPWRFSAHRQHRYQQRAAGALLRLKFCGKRVKRIHWEISASQMLPVCMYVYSYNLAILDNGQFFGHDVWQLANVSNIWTDPCLILCLKWCYCCTVPPLCTQVFKESLGKRCPWCPSVCMGSVAV